MHPATQDGPGKDAQDIRPGSAFDKVVQSDVSEWASCQQNLETPQETLAALTITVANLGFGTLIQMHIHVWFSGSI